MSNTIQPWIKTYLVYLAETYGGNLMGMPQEPKNKKVQAIEACARLSYLRIDTLDIICEF